MKNKLYILKKIIFAMAFFCLSSISISAQLNPGDIMFVGFRFDGIDGDLNCEDGFAFAALADIPANTTIYFTEEDYNGSSFGPNCGDLSWSHSSMIPNGTVIQIITNSEAVDVCGGMNPGASASIGTAQFASIGANSWAAATSNEEIYAYLGAVRQPTTWLCAMFTDNSTGENTPPAALNGFILDFTTVDQDADLGMLTSGLNCATPAACLANILDLNNWTTENGAGADCCDADGVNYPGDLPLFLGTPTTFSALTNVCFNGGLQSGLSGGSPSGGVYSGTGVTDNGNGMTFSFDPSLTGVGTHTITYTVNGQSATSTINIAIPVSIDVVGSDDILCNGDANGSIFTSTMNGTGAYAYLWSNGSTSATLSGVSGGTYTVTVTDADGCTATSGGSISEPPALEVTMSVDANACVGQATGAATASATGGTPPFTYGWFNGDASQTELGPGTYNITVSDANNCQITSSVTITELPSPTVTFTSPGSFLIDAGVQSNLGGGSPTGGTYSGAGVADNGDGTFNFDPTAAGAGDITVTYSYTDANGCSGTADATISVTIPVPGDECDDANDIQALFGQPMGAAQTSALHNNNNATTSASDPTAGIDCFTDNNGPPELARTLWYSFVGDGNTYLIKTVSCSATDYIDFGDTQMAIYSGDDCNNLTPVACNDDEDTAGQIYNAYLSGFLAEDGVTYYVMIDGWGASNGEYCIEVTLEENTAVTNIAATNIELFPNPTTGVINLENVETDRVEVFDNLGRLVKTILPINNQMDMSTLATGIYFLKIYAADEVFSARVIKE